MIFRSTALLLLTILASTAHANCPAEQPPVTAWPDDSGVSCDKMHQTCNYGACVNPNDGLTGILQCRCANSKANFVCSCRGDGLKEDEDIAVDTEDVATTADQSGSASVVTASSLLAASGAIVAALL